jgi:glycosyltransferase involved in cell wall biosynthesis
MKEEVKQNPKVSVLMAAYNTEKYIKDSIESILDQTFKDFELIILDDASKDSTWKIIKDYESKDSRVRVFQNEKNLTISPTRNKLIGLSTADYIAWQDADDISLPERLQKQYEYMLNNPKVGICGGSLQFFNDKENLSVRDYNEKDKDLRGKLFLQSPVSQPAAMIRKSILDKTGLFDVNLPQAEDLDLSFRIC